MTIEISDEEKIEKAIQGLIKVNNLEFNMLKVLEESTELNELLIKTLTKIDSLKPSKSSVIEETGDLIARIMVFVRHADIEERVSQRVVEKLTMLGKACEKGNMGSTVTITKTNK